jgi:hypothetical protein
MINNKATARWETIKNVSGVTCGKSPAFLTHGVRSSNYDSSAIRCCLFAPGSAGIPGGFQ